MEEIYREHEAYDMNKKSLWMKIIWWVYILLLFCIVILKFGGSVSELGNRISAVPFGTNYNLIPFKSIGEQLEHFSEGWARFNLMGNIIPFAPFGFLLPMVSEKETTLLKVLRDGFLFVLFAEIFQFFTRLGTFDVDDIILNMSGVFVGYLLIRFCTVIRKRER